MKKINECCGCGCTSLLYVNASIKYYIERTNCKASTRFHKNKNGAVTEWQEIWDKEFGISNKQIKNYQGEY